MPSLRSTLAQRLEPATRLAILGIGSDLRGDDAAGILVAERLIRAPALRARRRANAVRHLKIFLGGTAPENLTGEIIRYRPSHLVLVDAADMGARPGAIRLLDQTGIGGLPLSTHQLPLTVMLDYLKQFGAFEALLLGIQPRSLAALTPPTPAVAAAIARLVRALESVLGAHDNRGSRKRAGETS